MGESSSCLTREDRFRRRTLGGAVGEGESPVVEGSGPEQGNRQYHPTREIGWEAGTTTFQG